MVHAKMMKLLPEVYHGRLASSETTMGEFGGQKMAAHVTAGGLKIAAISQVFRHHSSLPHTNPYFSVTSMLIPTCTAEIVESSIWTTGLFIMAKRPLSPGASTSMLLLTKITWLSVMAKRTSLSSNGWIPDFLG